MLNVSTETATSFRRVAEMLVSQVDTPMAKKGTPRQNPITHRHFDITSCIKAFPDFHYTPLSDGLARMRQDRRRATNG